jgi:hypothetical protein
MEGHNHWKNERLFDVRPYTVRRYITANVIELQPIPLPVEGHDDSFDHLKCENVYDFPEIPQEPEPEAA